MQQHQPPRQSGDTDSWQTSGYAPGLTRWGVTVNGMNTATSEPVRVPLTRLAAEDRSPLLARVVPQEREDGAEPVAVAAFQSAV